MPPSREPKKPLRETGEWLNEPFPPRRENELENWKMFQPRQFAAESGEP